MSDKGGPCLPMTPLGRSGLKDSFADSRHLRSFGSVRGRSGLPSYPTSEHGMAHGQQGAGRRNSDILKHKTPWVFPLWDLAPHPT
ncbi:hypothetical protein VTH06DRAFT_7170 [Thermothelomyces fergusii]